MNANFGLFPPLAIRVKKKERKPAYAARSLADLAEWLGSSPSEATA
jgi:methylenetetrahydrofolate--tRNA-(uracil-5-)-methyltransferase